MVYDKKNYYENMQNFSLLTRKTSMNLIYLANTKKNTSNESEWLKWSKLYKIILMEPRLNKNTCNS